MRLIGWLFYVNGNNRGTSYDTIYFDSLRAGHIQTEIKKFIGDKNIIINNYRKQAYDSIMCRYFCFRFIAWMLKGKSLHEYANLFSPNNYEKNDKIILKYFQ